MHCRKRPRLEDFPYVGKYTYFLTFCASDRRPVFTNAEDREHVMSQFRHFAGVERFAETAHIVMPDHIHLVTRGLDDVSDVTKYVKSSKQQSGFDYKAKYRRRLWQPSFHDHVVRDDFELWRIIRYIVLNPVRAGLASDPLEYPHWSVSGWSKEEVADDVRRHPGDVWIPPRQDGKGQERRQT